MYLFYAYIICSIRTYVKVGGITLVKFSVRLREVRKSKGKKLQETADCVGIKLRSYQAYEQGTNEPNIEKLILLADFFDVSLDYLMGRTAAP